MRGRNSSRRNEAVSEMKARLESTMGVLLFETHDIALDVGSVQSDLEFANAHAAERLVRAEYDSAERSVAIENIHKDRRMATPASIPKFPELNEITGLCMMWRNDLSFAHLDESSLDTADALVVARHKVLEWFAPAYVADQDCRPLVRRQRALQQFFNDRRHEQHTIDLLAMKAMTITPILEPRLRQVHTDKQRMIVCRAIRR